MSNHVTLLQDLDTGKDCSAEAAAVIRTLEAENAQLTRWKKEAIEVLASWDEVFEKSGLKGQLGKEKSKLVLAALTGKLVGYTTEKVAKLLLLGVNLCDVTIMQEPTEVYSEGVYIDFVDESKTKELQDQAALEEARFQAAALRRFIKFREVTV